MWPLGLPLVVLTAAQSSLEEASVSLRYWFVEIFLFFCEIAEKKLKLETYNIRNSVRIATRSHAL